MDQQIPAQEPPKVKFDNKKVVLIVTIVLTVVGFSTSGILLSSNINLKKENTILEGHLNDQQEKTNDLEKELIFYKNTDLAKEAELLQLKLDTTEKELTQTKNTLTTTEKSLNDLRAKIEDIPQLVSIVSLMYETAGKQPPTCFGQSDKSKILQDLNEVGDTRWISLWNEFISETNSTNCTHSPQLLQKALDHGYQKILGMLK